MLHNIMSVRAGKGAHYSVLQKIQVYKWFDLQLEVADLLKTRSFLK